MTTVPDLGLGDVVRAFATLAPERRSTAVAIVGLLGFDLGAQPDARHVEDSEAATESGTDALSIALRGARPDDGPVRVLQPVSTEPPSRMETDGWSTAEPIEERVPGQRGRILSHESLLAPGKARPMIAAAASSMVEDARIDMDSLVDTISRGLVVHQIPRRARPSLVRGVQLLIDHGEGMEPFARDQEELVADIHRVVGSNAVTGMTFRDVPTEVLRGGEWHWTSYTAPPHRTPVLAITDLGVGRRATRNPAALESAWLAIAGQLRRRGSHLVAFVPYPPARWPRTLSPFLTIVQWDRSTTISTVQAAVRAARAQRQ